MKSLKHVYKNLMSERASAGANILYAERYKFINLLEDEEGLPVENDLINSIFKTFEKSDTYSVTINEEDSEGNKYSKQKPIDISIDSLLNYIFYLHKTNVITNLASSLNFLLPEDVESKYTDENMRLSASIKKVYQNIMLENNTEEIETVRKARFEEDNTTKSSSHVVSKVLESSSLGNFRLNFFYFLYKRLISPKIRLVIKDNQTRVDNSIFDCFREILSSNAQNAFSVSLGTLFEEIYKGYSKHIINDGKLESIDSYLKGESFDLNLANKNKKISIVLILVCNKKLKTGSAIYEKLKLNSAPDVSDYKSDFLDHVLINDSGKAKLFTGITNILNLYKSLINVDNSSIYFDDYENDNIFCKYNGITDEVKSGLGNYSSNAPFDFIIRQNNDISSIGLFDLKVRNHSSSSSPIVIGATGNNGGSMNSGCKFLQDMINVGRSLNEDFAIKFLGLIQVTYNLDFEPNNEIGINVTSVDHRLGDVTTSITKSMDQDKFKIYTAASEDDVSKKIYSGEDEINANSLEYVLKDSEREYNITQIKREIQKDLLSTVLKDLRAVYENHSNINKYIESKQSVADLKVFFDSIKSKVVYDLKNKEKAILDEEYKTDAYDEHINIISNLKGDSYANVNTLSEAFLAFVFYNDNAESADAMLENNYFLSLSEESKSIVRLLKEIKTSDGKYTPPRLYRSITSCILNIFNSETGSGVNIKQQLDDLRRRSDRDEVISIDVLRSLQPSTQPTLRTSGLISDQNKSNFASMCKNQIKLNISDNSSNTSEESSGQRIGDSYIRQGQTLVEVYSSLYKKKLIVEGGLGGHMMHPYEMLDSTPREMINQIKRYSLPQSIVEKVDGQNLFFTVERDGTLLFARNKEDMTHDDLIEKFKGHGAEKPFVEGSNAIKSGVEQGLVGREEEVIAIFHPSEDVRSFINFEIMHPEKPNQIRYDQKYIVFHSIVDYKEGRVQVGSSATDERIAHLINLIRSGIESSGFILASNQTVDLNTLEDVQISEYEDRVMDASSALRISDDQTFADGIMNMISDELQAEGVVISDEALSILRDYVIYGEDASGRKIHSKEFTKIISKEDAAKLRSLGLTTSTKVMSKIGKILMPFKDIFVDLGIDLLKGVKSSYMSDDNHQQNIEDIKDKLQTAINDIDRYTSEVAEENWSNVIIRLMPHVRKVKQKGIENIVASSVEGGVYSHDDNLMKLTGGFAPMNQIVGAAYRDNEGIFTEFNSKFKKIESVKRSLKGVFSLIF